MKSACKIRFILLNGWISATCTWNKLFPRGALKNRWFEKLFKITGKHKKESSGGVLLKDVLKNLSEAAAGNVLLKKVFLKRRTGVSEPAVYTSSTQKRCFEQFIKFTGKYLCLSPFLIKFQFWGPAALLKKTRTQVLSREIYKLPKNNYFEEHLWNAASKHYLKRDSNTVALLWILWIIQECLFSRGSTNDQWGLQSKINLFGGAMIN